MLTCYLLKGDPTMHTHTLAVSGKKLKVKGVTVKELHGVLPDVCQWMLKFAGGPAKAKKKPLTMSATPQTQSWFWKNSSRSALGIPKSSPAAPTILIAFPRSTPRSMSRRDAISIMATRLVHAANTSAKKKSA